MFPECLRKIKTLGWIILLGVSCCFCQNTSNVDILVSVNYTNPSQLLSILDKGGDPQLLIHDFQKMADLIRSKQGFECTKILLKHCEGKINDSKAGGCSLLPLTLHYPKILQLFLDNGADPYWKNKEYTFPRKIQLIDFLFKNAASSPESLKSFEIAINHKSCDYQISGSLGKDLHQKALKLKPQDPGMCATGYTEYVDRLERSKSLALNKTKHLQ